MLGIWKLAFQDPSMKYSKLCCGENMDCEIQVKAGFICDNTAVLRPETKDMFSNAF
jgi:hypothetical protein